MLKKLLIAFFLLGAGFAVYRYLDKPEAARISLRQLDAGQVVGFDTGRGSLAWLGIPFAQPPVGELRWRPPRAVTPWEGVREALAHPPFCSQVLPFEWLPSPVSFGSEDCLYLNVWTPVMDSGQAAKSRLPVMVWIHGGANVMGGSAAADPHRFAEQEGLVVVSLQYRLGILGWFSHPALRQTATAPLERSSNFALLDMVAALQWVQANIEQFGGDPGKVTIFGQSAGAFNVLALLAVPQAEGLLHRAIAQSGNTHTVPREQAENYRDAPVAGLPYSNREFVNRLLVAEGRAANREEAKSLQNSLPGNELAAYLRGKPAGELLGAVDLRPGLAYATPTNIRDGIVLPERSLLEVLGDPQAHHRVPLILGNNRDEYRMWLSGRDDYVERRFLLWKRIRDPDQYRRMSAYFSDQWQMVAVDEPARALQASQPGSVYAYRLDWAGQPTRFGVDESELYGASHGIEVVFLFGPDAVSSLPDYARPQDQAQWDQLSDRMLRYWANFARNGEPGGGDDLPHWQPWTPQQPKKMLFDAPGGTKMATDTVYASDLKARLRRDPLIASERERCELYVQLFLYALSSEFWDPEEYAALGCADYPPESFEAVL